MTFTLGMLEWVAASAVIAAGTIVHGSVGFGVALITAPLLHLIDPILVPGPMILVGLTIPALVLWREWRSVDAGEVGRILPGVAAGVAAASVVMRKVPEAMLAVLFGTLVLSAVGLSVKWRPPPPGWGTLSLAGGLAGFMTTTTSIGGPPLALVFQSRAPGNLRGTLSACFIPISVLALGALFGAGRLGMREILIASSLLPAALLGFWISGRTAALLDRWWLRGAVLAVSATAAASTIVRAVVS